MVWALLAAFLTKRPPWIQAVVVGLCVGLFVAASAQANQRNPLLSSTVVLVLVSGAVAGVLFFLGLCAQRRRSPSIGSPLWVGIVYITVWVVSIVAAIRALFGDGGFKVAALAIVPIVLLAPVAVVAIRTMTGHPPAPPDADAPTASGT